MDGDWVVCVELHMLPGGPRRRPSAGAPQIAASEAALRAAHERGLRTAVLAVDRPLYGDAFDEFVDRWLITDTSDVECAAEELKRLDGGIAAIYSPVDAFVRVAAALARRHGLPGPEPDGSGIAVDKAAARRALDAAGVPDARWACRPAAQPDLSSPIGYPCVVKPIDGVSSWDVMLAENDADVREVARRHLRRRYRRALRPQHVLLFEEYLEGPMYSAEGIVASGGPTILGYSDRVLSAAPYFVELGSSVAVDPPCPEADVFVRDCLAALDYDFGAFHLEFVVTAQGPRLVELNPRFVGAGTHHALGRLIGVPPGELLTAVLLGERPPRRDDSDGAGGNVNGSGTGTGIDIGAVADVSLTPPCSGALRGYRGLEEAVARPGCTAAGLYVSIGDRVSAAVESNDQRCGHTQAVGTDRADAHAKAAAAAECITLDIS
jgi:biotin carboxylase